MKAANYFPRMGTVTGDTDVFIVHQIKIAWRSALTSQAARAHLSTLASGHNVPETKSDFRVSYQ